MVHYKDSEIKAGIYCRLSVDDGSIAQDSISIQNQRDLLTDYCNKHNWKIVEVYVDDGYSGTNFNRPAFKEMLFDIENGRINTVITKDLSRLGRDYLNTGKYIERYFPDHDVRYIAMSDNVDTQERENDFLPFQNIINEIFAKDVSKKIHFTLDNQMKSGKSVKTTCPLYGYMYDANSNRIPDPETAPVVKMIFDLFVSGNSYAEIARVLEEKIINHTYLKKYDSQELIKTFMQDYRKEVPYFHDKTDADIFGYFNGARGLHSLNAILSFSYVPQLFYPTTGIKIYDQEEPNTTTIIDGPITQQIRKIHIYLKQKLKGNLTLDKKGNIIENSKPIIQILLELIYNAIIHKDYSHIYIHQPIAIHINKDDITITNPGYFISDYENLIDDPKKITRNRELKYINDILLKHETPFPHGFKNIKKLANLYNIQTPSLKNAEEGTFKATIHQSTPASIYNGPLSIAAILRFCATPKTKLELYQHFTSKKSKDYGYFHQKYIQPLIEKGALRYTNELHPKSPNQTIQTTIEYLQLLS